MPTPRRTRKTADVMLPMSKTGATTFLRRHMIPFTNMREMSGGGVMVRIRAGYLNDFMHQMKTHGGGRVVPNPRKRSARAMGASRRVRRNPSPKHGARETFELSFFQGYAVEIGYRREIDGKLYKHDVETDAAELYLATHPVFGKCLVILDPSGRTPLWK